MPEILIGTVTDNNGLVINVWATEIGGNTTFKIDVVGGYADLRGFFFDYTGVGTISVALTGDDAWNQNGNLILDDKAVTASYMGTATDGSDITKVGSSDNNLNGTGQVFDAGLEFGTSGIGKDDIGTVTFTINGLTLSEIDAQSFGIRATSVGANRTDSVKLVGEFDVPAANIAAPVLTVENASVSLAENAAAGDIAGADADATDADGDTITFSLVNPPVDGSSNPLFAINSSTGQISLMTAGAAFIDYETTPSYVLTVKASDGLAAHDQTTTVTINVTDVNEQPSAGADFSADAAENVNATTVLATVTGTDPDFGGGNDALNNFENLSYAIQNDLSGKFEIDATTGAISLAAGQSLDFETAQSHVVTVRVSDGPGLFDDVDVTINVTDVNEQPSAGADFSADAAENVNATTVLATVTGTDPDFGGGNDALNNFENLSYAIQNDLSGKFEIDATTGAISLAAGQSLDFETAQSHVVTVRVSDGPGLFDDVDVTINVTDVNEQPSAGADFSADAAENVNATTVLATVTGTDPDFGGGNDALNNFENLSYAIQNDLSGKFEIDATTGAISLAAGQSLDFETAQSHVVTVRVSDGPGLFDDVDVTINVTDVNEQPSAGADFSADAAENVNATTVLATVTGTDPDFGGGNDALNNFENLSYAIQNDLSGKFEIDATTGAISLAAGQSLDFETAQSHVVTVRVSDGPGLFDDVDVTINVTDVNEQPSAGADFSADAAENVNATTVLATVTGTDPDFGGGNDALNNFENLSYAIQNDLSGKFEIDATTGAISLAAGQSLDFETAQSHVVTVRVSDGPGLFDDVDVTINVTDVNEQPSAGADFSADAAENVNATTVLATVTGTDPDFGGGNDALNNFENLSYAIQNDLSGKFEIDATTGAISLAAGQSLDFETAQSHVVTVRVSDGPGLFDDVDVTINVTDVNEQPSAGADFSADAAENVNATTVLATVTGTDPDFGGGNDALNNFENLSYAIQNDLSGKFEIDATTGAISLAAGQSLDFETAQSHVVTVRVSDGPGLFDDVDVTINVTDVNEQPSAGADFSADAAENVNATTVLATVTGTDPDFGGGNDALNNFENLSYAIQNDLSGKFEIDATTGAISLAAGQSLDFETAQSHVVTVRVSDGPGLFDDVDVTINVTDVNEQPSAGADFSADAAENVNATTVLATVTGTDPDFGGGNDALNNFENLSYAIQNDLSGKFEIDATTGAISLAAGQSLDFETAQSHVVTVRVSDGPGLFDDVDVTINVTDVNEQPSAGADFSADAAENVNATTVLATVTGTDPDFGGGNDALNNFENLSYAIQNDLSGKFEIDATTGAISLAAGQSLDFETAQSHVVTVRVSDGPGLFDDVDVTINVTDVNEQPSAGADFSADAAENVNATTVLATVTGTDPDFGGGNDALNNFENLSYAIQNDLSGKFEIDATTGAISLAAGQSLDFETAQSHVVTVRVSDGPGLFDDVDVTINVTDVNEAPTDIIWNAVQPESQTNLPDGNPNLLANLASVDPDNTSGFTYSLQSASPAAGFAVSTGGAVTTTGLAQSTTYTLVIRSTDAGTPSASFDETFNIITGSNAGETLPPVGTGDAGDDILYGSGQIDIVLGGSGNDTLFGQNGDDQLTGGTGNDALYGGNNDDQYIFAFTGDGNDIIDESAAAAGGGGNSDRIQIGSGTFTSLNFERLDSNAAVDTDTAADDLIISYNGQQIDVLNHYTDGRVDLINFGSSNYLGYSLSGNYNLNVDITTPLDGGSGNDLIASDSDAGTPDTLNGLAGNDLLFGDGGNDILNGGNDVDLLIGGAGADRFVFASGASGQTSGSIDVIGDYTKGNVGTGDIIDYSAALTIGGSAAAASVNEASINAATGVATFAAGSGTTLADALSDIATRFTAVTDASGEFALFQVNNAGDYYAFISDGVAGVGANDVVVQLTGVNSIASIDLTLGDLTILT